MTTPCCNQMKLSQGQLSGQGMSYRALVFYNTVSVPVPTLLRARDFARAGGAVIAIGRLPEEGVGLVANGGTASGNQVSKRRDLG